MGPTILLLNQGPSRHQEPVQWGFPGRRTMIRQPSHYAYDGPSEAHRFVADRAQQEFRGRRRPVVGARAPNLLHETASQLSSQGAGPPGFALLGQTRRRGSRPLG